MTTFNCNDTYRNGGDMQEPEEPHVPDTVDWFERSARNVRVVARELQAMGYFTGDEQ